jgi:general secretion pathway protein D
MRLQHYRYFVLVFASASILAWPLEATQTAAQTNGPAKPPAQNSAPAQKPAPQTVVVCPGGEAPVRTQTPFGAIETCSPTQAPGATTPAPPAAAPSTEGQQPAQKAPMSDTTAKPPAPGATAPAQPATTQAKEPVAPQAQGTSGEKIAAEIATSDNSSDSPVMLNLENADLYQVLRILGPELKINTIIDPAVKGSVTINTSTTVKRKDLFGLLEMLLEINGATAVKQANGYYAIVPLGSAKQQAVELHYAKQSDQPIGSQDGYTLQVVAMKFISGTEMSRILTPFMSPGGQIVVQDKGNLLFLSDSAAKLAEVKQIIDLFDDPVLGRQRVRIFRVANNLATNLVPELRSVFAGYGLSAGNTAIQFIPIERLNSILVVSPSVEVFDEVDSWIQKLDQPTQEVGLRTYVYQVQNAKASDLGDVLGQLYGVATAGPAAGAATTAPGPAIPQSALTGTVTPENPAAVMGPMMGAPTQAAARPSSPGAPGGAASATPVGMQSNVRFMADDRNNSLIVQATPHDYDLIQHTLRDMDILPRQVLIDARIYEVNLTGDLQVGLQAFLDKTANLANPNITTSGQFAGASPSLALQTFAILHNTYQLQLFLNASENRTRVKTLSAPSILVTNNTAARIQVGSEVPVPIGSALTPVQSGGNSVFAQTIQFRDTGVILSVTPRINASGVIMLNIAQEVSSAQPNSTSGIVAPVISKSQFQTTAMLKDGQTLALGGIITTSNTVTKNRIPLLGDIPGLGLLFGSTGLSTARKELVLVITPHVSTDLNESTKVSNEFMNSMKNLKKDLSKLPQAK